MGACKLLELLANSARSAALRAWRLILLPGPRLLLDIPELMLKPSDEAEKSPRRQRAAANAQLKLTVPTRRACTRNPFYRNCSVLQASLPIPFLLRPKSDSQERAVCGAQPHARVVVHSPVCPFCNGRRRSRNRDTRKAWPRRCSPSVGGDRRAARAAPAFPGPLAAVCPARHARR
jgi:hypothetical protein